MSTGLHPNVRKMLEDFYRGEKVELHRGAKARWPWYGKFLHWALVSWRCPACKEIHRVDSREVPK